MMVHSEDVRCKVCGKKLAHWDMFSNDQWEEEYECLGEYRRTVHNLYRSKDGKTLRRFFHSEDVLPGYIEKKTEMGFCALHFHTKYCKNCAQKLHFHCVRPRCKGPVRLVRRKDGSSTKYTHAGY